MAEMDQLTMSNSVQESASINTTSIGYPTYYRNNMAFPTSQNVNINNVISHNYSSGNLSSDNPNWSLASYIHKF